MPLSGCHTRNGRSSMTRSSKSASRRIGPIAPASTALRATFPQPTWASLKTPASSRRRANLAARSRHAQLRRDAVFCPAFALRLVRGVKNGHRRTGCNAGSRRSVCARSIGSSIYQFVTYDRARPLHVFDAAKVRGNLTVRRARAIPRPEIHNFTSEELEQFKADRISGQVRRLIGRRMAQPSSK